MTGHSRPLLLAAAVAAASGARAERLEHADLESGALHRPMSHGVYTPPAGTGWSPCSLPPIDGFEMTEVPAADAPERP